ncbi:MAG: hypothetical protein KJ904_03495 [Alphaproteobacteria bacterium]|nr:hypothetical protein [Alphaproteobacteria bacterium]MBU0798516.1 hypothetical protein [Alphaproteobacteria bacterium]MBU0886204.1 hypothetical protein [Alphaproteobacteria bacterium]MBU1812844.1 hypothetical protein [Alphaproteobacteria bacterium]MBU2090582.1 hypothetical protein [Alphaproteobacteria bacterium]
MNDIESTPSDRKEEAPVKLGRREMLMRLGLASAAVYAAPVLLNLNPANASKGSKSSRGSHPSRGSKGSRGDKRHSKHRHPYDPRKRQDWVSRDSRRYSYNGRSISFQELLDLRVRF